MAMISWIFRVTGQADDLVTRLQEKTRFEICHWFCPFTVVWINNTHKKINLADVIIA
jgi:hypothetical protein